MSTPGVQPPAQIGYYTYGEPLDVKFGWLSGKPGMAAVAEAAATLGDMGNLYTGSQDFVTAALREADVEWHGRAAESAGHALRTLAGRGGVAGTAGAGGGTSLEGYGQSFEELRSQVHYEQPGVLGWDDALLPGGSVRWMADQYRIVEANRNADATAVLAFRNHESVTRTALDTFPTLEAAPPVVADIGAAAPPGPGGLPGVGPFGPGGAGGAPGGLTSATAGGPGAAAVAGATPLPDGAAAARRRLPPAPWTFPRRRPHRSRPGCRAPRLNHGRRRARHPPRRRPGRQAPQHRPTRHRPRGHRRHDHPPRPRRARVPRRRRGRHPRPQ